MVDLDYRISSHAQSAGLKRLSARAQAGAAPPSSGGRRVFFSFASHARAAIDHLRSCQVPIEKGLSDEEFARVEASYGFTFPPDLKAILHEGLPVGEEFPNWRLGSSHQLQTRLDLPSAGLLYEVAKGNLWWKQWGPRPIDTEQAVVVALKAIRKAPFLVPVYSHCYVPSSPNLAGNPVFFAFRKDVFICGIDVADFFQRNQFTPHDYKPPKNMQDLVEWIEDGGSRVARLGSGRHSSKERGRTIYGKENAIVPRIGHSDDDGFQDRRQQRESTHGHSDDAASEEVEKKWEGLEGDFESWGRNLDTLVAKHSEVLFESLDNLGRRPGSKVFDHKPRHHQHRQQNNSNVSRRPRTGSVRKAFHDRFSYFEDALSSKTLMQFSMNAPPWAAKFARRIEFWSELPEKRLQLTNGIQPLTLFSAQKVDSDVSSFTRSGSWEDSVTADPPKEALTKFRTTILPKWLVTYLEDITLQLREGGWEEGDIEDIMETSSDSSNPYCKLSESFCSDKQSVLDALSRQAEALSSSLREAGWSMRDVAEVLNLSALQRTSNMEGVTSICATN